LHSYTTEKGTVELCVDPELDPDMGPRFGTPNWDPKLGPRFGNPIWNPKLGPRTGIHDYGSILPPSIYFISQDNLRVSNIKNHFLINLGDFVVQVL
jgi:hypothetical protein